MGSSITRQAYRNAYEARKEYKGSMLAKISAVADDPPFIVSLACERISEDHETLNTLHRALNTLDALQMGIAIGREYQRLIDSSASVN